MRGIDPSISTLLWCFTLFTLVHPVQRSKNIGWMNWIIPPIRSHGRNGLIHHHLALDGPTLVHPVQKRSMKNKLDELGNQMPWTHLSPSLVPWEDVPNLVHLVQRSIKTRVDELDDPTEQVLWEHGLTWWIQLMK